LTNLFKSSLRADRGSSSFQELQHHSALISARKIREENLSKRAQRSSNENRNATVEKSKEASNTGGELSSNIYSFMSHNEGSSCENGDSKTRRFVTAIVSSHMTVVLLFLPNPISHVGQLSNKNTLVKAPFGADVPLFRQEWINCTERAFVEKSRFA
jgi:hypothetical protein